MKQKGKKTIAIFAGDIPSSSFIEHLINGLADHGFFVIVFGKRKKKVSYGHNIEAYYFASSVFAAFFCIVSELIKMLFSQPGMLFRLNQLPKNKGFIANVFNWQRYLLILNQRPDLLHIQWIKQGHEWLFLRDFGIKVVASFRGSHINYSPIADQRLVETYQQTFPLYDGFHAVSDAIAKKAMIYNAKPEQIFTIKAGITPELLNKEKSNSLKNGERFSILSVGRPHWVKGYTYALEALKILKDEGTDFVYKIVGASSEDEELVFTIHDLGLTNHVELMGNVPHNLIAGVYFSANVLLLPSLDEGIANVVLEAMALGVPVVSTVCGGMAEVINDGENGYLVPIRNSQLMAERLSQIANEKVPLEGLIHAAKETIHQNHLLSQQMDGFIRFYSSII